jgi:hypothetical protein
MIYESGTFDVCHVIMYTGSSIRVMGSCGVWGGVYHLSPFGCTVKGDCGDST